MYGYKKGGPVKESGPAKVHKGEMVIDKKSRKPKRKVPRSKSR